MRITFLVTLMISVLAASAQAQQERGGGRPDGPRGQMGPGGPGGMGLGPMAQRLAGELGLTAEQQQQYDAIVAKYQAKAEESQGDREQARELARQYREARQSGDEAKAEELRAQMEQGRAGREQVMQDFMNEVKTILDEGQIKKLEAARERFRQGAVSGRRMAEMRDLMRRLPDELQLTEEQRTQYDALLAEQRKQMEDQRSQLRPLMEQLREARAAGDEQRAAELQAEIDQKRPAAPDPSEFFNKLEPILTPAQKEKLTELRANANPQRGLTDVRAVLRAGKQLDLTDQQRERFKEITREAQAAERQATDTKARAELAQRVKAQIVEILDAKQVTEFEQLLQRADRSGRQGRGGADQGERGGRQGRGGTQNP